MPYQLYINGQWRDASKGALGNVHNPATGELVSQYAFGNVADAVEAMDAAETAFETWKTKTVYERAAVLVKAASNIRQRTVEIARMVTLETGKPLGESEAETVGCAQWFEWFAEEAKRNDGRIIPTHTTGKRLHVLRQPVGVVVAVTPWNFPINLMCRKIAPALAVGCTMVCRPASETPLCAMLVFECLHDAGAPAGVINLVTGPSAEIVAAMLRHRACRKLAFTGSTPVGKKLMAIASEKVIRLSLELGGHAPMIVFPDVDVAWAAEQAVTGKFRNAGQSCIAPTRFYVHRSIYDRFRDEVVKRTAALRVGDGLEPGVQVGPMINQKQLKSVMSFIEDAIAKGANVLTGGKHLTEGAFEKGYFVQPTVLDNIKPEMRLTCEEVFGPVMPLFPFDDEKDVITAANNTEFGLAAYVMSRDIGVITRVTEALEYGIVAVNDSVPTVPHAEFGGWKESGMNREGGHQGLDAYLETKYISMGI
jgi:succinate-semialdehyde dehydrogenase/glutarate-semialdehyde dehydrogenase